MITVGANYYFAGNNAKFSADVGYALDEVTSFWAGGAGGAGLGAGGAVDGWRQDGDGEDGQLVLRGQFQLAF